MLGAEKLLNYRICTTKIVYLSFFYPDKRSEHGNGQHCDLNEVLHLNILSFENDPLKKLQFEKLKVPSLMYILPEESQI